MEIVAVPAIRFTRTQVAALPLHAERSESEPHVSARVSWRCSRSSVTPTSFPRSVPSTGRPVPDRILVARVLRRRRYHERLRLLVACAAVLLRASFPSLGGASRARRVRVPRGLLRARRAARAGLGLRGRLARVPLLVRRRRDLPGSCGASVRVLRSVRPRWILGTPDRWVLRCCLPQSRRRRLPPQNDLSGLDGAARALAVYASRPSSRADSRKTCFRLVINLSPGSSLLPETRTARHRWKVSATFIRVSFP